jgi:isoquinoline 1-oxidoreductase beta subunit
LVRGEVAKALGMKEEQVEVQPTYLGGGFGRKTGFEAAVEAARLSKAAGVPVHVGWTRTEDMRYGYFRPPTHHILSARLGSDQPGISSPSSTARRAATWPSVRCPASPR